MKLHELRDNEGAARKKKRVARGPGSGKGKTAAEKRRDARLRALQRRALRVQGGRGGE